MSERRTDDATLIEAVRILSRTITTEDGVIPACLAEVANRLETLVEDNTRLRKGIVTLLESQLRGVACAPSKGPEGAG